MTAALTTLLGVALAALLAMVQWQLVRISNRLDRINEILTRTEATLVSHITDHPAPGRRS
jgi:cytochrome oxidase assembly protein ShyY1